MSTVTLMNMESSLMYPPLSRVGNDTKRGQPMAMFISLCGRWNEDEDAWVRHEGV